MAVMTNGREEINMEQIHNLNQLSWDKKNYANCYGDGGYYLNVTYRFGGDEYRYRVNCKSQKDLEQLRALLDEKCYINEDGYCVSKK